MSPSRVSGHACRWLAALAIWFGSALSSQGDPPAPPETLQFRRVYVPADRFNDWKRRLEYVPVDAELFERLVQSASPTAHAGPTRSTCRIERAEYQVGLLSDEELHGKARWVVAHDSQEPAMLPLNSCGLAIHTPRWETSNEPALLGLSDTGGVNLLVERPGVVAFDFTLRGQSRSGASATFDFALPGSPLNSMEITAPVDRAVSASRGCLTALNEGEMLGRYRLSLGGQNRFQLHFKHDNQDARRHGPVIAQSASTYDLSRRGVEMATQLTLDVQQTPLSRVTVSLSQGLSLVSARLGANGAPCTIVRHVEEGASEVELVFPEPLLGTGKLLRLSALAPVSLGSPWKLPTIRPEGVWWQEGQATLLIPASLHVLRLAPTGCRESGATPRPGKLLGEAIQLQCYQPDSEIELILTEGSERVQVETGTAIRLSAGETMGSVVAAFRANSGARFSLESDISPQWTIDAVTSDPPEAVSDWEVALQEFPRRTLHIELSEALSASNPIKLFVSGRRLRSPLGETLGLAELQIVDFHEAANLDRLIEITTEGPFQIRLSGDENLARLDPQRLEAGLTELFLSRPRGLLFRVTPDAPAVGFSLERQATRFTAEVRVDVDVVDRQLIERYALRCRTESAGLERLLVRFFPARSDALRWILADGREIPARRLEDDPKAESSGESWELSLPPALGEEIQFRAERSSPLAGPDSISLAAVPAATSQSGVVAIRSGGDSVLDVSEVRLDPLPLPETPQSSPDQLDAWFRYDPSHDLTTGSPPVCRVTPLEPTHALPGAIIWDLRISSGVMAAGTARHRAVMQLQNERQPSLVIQFPAGAVLQAAQLDDRRLTQRLDNSQRLVLSLPTEERFVTIGVDFTTPWAGNHAVRSLDRPSLTADAPILAQQWTLWLPPGHEAWSSLESWLPPHQTPVSWMQRLFAASTPFPGAAQLDAQAQQRVAALLDAIGRSAAQRTDQPSVSVPTWRQVLAATIESKPLTGATLWIDHPALQNAGVEPPTPLAPVAGDTSAERGAAVLNQAGLVLLASGDLLLLTVDSERLSSETFDTREWGCSVGLLPDAQRGELAASKVSQEPGRYLTAAAWIAQTSSPWRPMSLEVLGPAELRGWSALRYDSGVIPHRVQIVRHSLIRWAAWGVFALTLALGWRRGKARWGLRLALCGFLAAAAFIVPAGPAPIIAASFWGAMLGWVRALGTLRQSLELSPRLNPSPSSRQRVSAIVAGALLLYLLTAHLAPTGLVQGDEERGASGSQSAVHLVLIPVADSNEEPENELPWKYYLAPQDFLRELERAAGAAFQRPRGWLIEQANYRAELQWENTPRRLGVAVWKANFDVQVFSADTLVRIPLSDGGGERPEKALVDGAVTPLEWSEDGRSLSFRVRERGSYRVEVALRPRPSYDASHASLQVLVPPTPCASVELLAPADAPTPEIVSSLGMVAGTEGSGRWQAWLGPADQILVRWPDGAPSSESTAQFDVESLFWLNVQPGSVILDARLKYKVSKGAVRRLRFRVDPRWRLLPQPEAEWVVLQTSSPSGEADLLELTLPHPETEQMVIPLRWMLAGSSGLGSFQLPNIQPIGAQALRRFLALSVDPALDRRELGAALPVMPPPDFLARWGEGSSSPQTAYELSDGDIDWGLATSPRPVRVQATETQAFSFALGRVFVRYAADLKHLTGPAFQYRVKLPSVLNLESVTVLEQGIARPARWARDEQGVMVFPLGPSGAEQRLELSGWMPLAGDGPFELPRLEWEGAALENSRVHLLRRPGMSVTVLDHSGLVEITDAAPPERTARDADRLVASFESLQPDYSATIGVRPISPLLSATQITALEREDRGNWIAEVRCRVNVSQDAQDELRLQLPRSWAGPFQIDPPMSHQLLDVPGEDRRLLVLRPRAPVKDQFQVTVRGAWPVAAGSKVSPPSVKLLGATEVERIFVVPRQIALQPVEWDVRGLLATGLPDELPTGKFPTSAFAAYRAIGETPDIVLRQTEPDAGDPCVHLADIRLTVEQDGRCLGVVRFDLSPAGSNIFVVEAAAECEIFAIRVAGASALAVRAGRGEWRIPLSSSHLPQQVEVLYRGAANHGDASGEWTLPAPRPANWRVERILVAIQAPSDHHLTIREPMLRQNGMEQELARIKSTITMLQEGADSVDASEDSQAFANWREPWFRRLISDWFGLIQQESAGRQDLRGIENSLAQIAGRFSLPWPQQRQEMASAQSLQELWQQIGHGHNQGAMLRWTGVGSAGLPITLKPGHRDGELFLSRLALVVALAGGSLAVGWLIDRRQGWPGVARRLPVWGVIAGLLWALWWTPGACGIALAVWSLWIGLRQRRRAVRQASERPAT